jgi:aryl-alcohol dehydrogenase-like predicted oxidoreductase
LEKALAVQVEGGRLFDTVQATWNLLEPSAGAALQAAHDAGLGVIVKEALANGRLTRRNQAPDFGQRRLVLAEEAIRLSTTIDALALAAVLAQPWVDMVLSGAATLEHLQANVAALAVRWDGQSAARLAALAEPPAQYWSTRAGLAWN